jgi:transcriptional regulator with XRE-family HTH domain
MILNRQLLRARRMELGLTSREVAREAYVSQPLIKRLEETGDASVLQVETLNAILRALSLDLTDALEQAPTATTATNLVAAIGGLLQERKRGVPTYEIASTLGATLDRIEAALQVLDTNLRPAGLRVHRNSSGVSIVPTARPDLGSGSGNERLRYLSNLNSGDLALLYRALTERVPANTVAATVNGNFNLQKLEGAGLVVVMDGAIMLTTRVVDLLGS